MCTPSKKTSVLDCLLISYALCSGHMLLKVVCVESAKQGRFEQRHCQSLSISAIKFLDCLLVSYPDDLLCSGQTLLQIVCVESAKHPNSTRPETACRALCVRILQLLPSLGHQTGTSRGSPWALPPPNWDQQGVTLGTFPTKMKNVFFSALKQKQKNSPGEVSIK